VIGIFRAHGINRWRRNRALFWQTGFRFSKQSVAVFVDGCFWHGLPGSRHEAGTNAAFWRKKIVRNSERDGEVTRALRKGWLAVLRVWEHALARKNEAGWRSVAPGARMNQGSSK